MVKNGEMRLETPHEIFALVAGLLENVTARVGDSCSREETSKRLLSLEMVVYHISHAPASCIALSLLVGVNVDDGYQSVMALGPSLQVQANVLGSKCHMGTSLWVMETSPDHHALEVSGAEEETSVLYSYHPPHLYKLGFLSDVWESGFWVEHCQECTCL